MVKRRPKEKESKEDLIRQEYTLWLAKMPKETMEEKAIAYDALANLKEAKKIVKKEVALNRSEKEIKFLLYPEERSISPYFLFSIVLRGEIIQQYKTVFAAIYHELYEKTIECFSDDVTIITSKNVYGDLNFYPTICTPYYQQTNRYKNNQLITSEEKRYNRIVRRAFMDQDNILVKQQIAGRNTVQGNYITSSQFDKRYKGALKRTRKKIEKGESQK